MWDGFVHAASVLGAFAPAVAPQPLVPPGSTVPELAWWRFAAGLAFLGYASVSDLAWRRVKNLTWVLLAALAGLFLVLDVTQAAPATTYLVLVPVFVLLAYLLWYSHLLYGGADAKALMAIAVLIPYPVSLAPGLPLAGSMFPGFATVLVDSLLIFLLIPVFYFVANLVQGDFAFPAMLLGRRMPLQKALDSKVWVMDRLAEDGGQRAAPKGEEEPADGPRPGTEGDEAGPAAGAARAEETAGGEAGAGWTGTEPKEEAWAASSEEEAPSGPLAADGPANRPAGAKPRVVLDYFPTRELDYETKIEGLLAAGVEKVWATPKVPFMIPLFLGFLAAHLLGDVLPWALLSMR